MQVSPDSFDVWPVSLTRVLREKATNILTELLKVPAGVL
jgi:hypothetical protein